MMAYSIFALGTYENTENESNVITQFYEVCEGKPTKEKLILNGPQQIISPSTVEKNTNYAIECIIKWLSEYAECDQDGKYRINICGFSRGAITAIKIANGLTQYFQRHTIRNKDNKRIKVNSIEINIFAIDPVAGLFEKRHKDSQILPSIVNQYVAVLQMHEYRNDLKPQDIKRIHVMDHGKTRVIMLPMYGNHGSVKKIVDHHVSHCTEIIWQHLYRFLISHQTKLKRIPAVPVLNKPMYPQIVTVLSDIALLELYAEAKKNKVHYENMGQWGLSFSGNGPRNFVKYLDEYVSDANFFMNDFEKRLFKSTYPAITSYLFEQGVNARFNDVAQLRKAMLAELRVLYKQSIILFDSLRKKGIYRLNRTIYYPNKPIGRAPLPLADEVMHKIFRYRHIKAEWKVFSKPDEYDRAISLSDRIALIRQSDNTIKQKNQLILNLLEEQCRELYERGGSSKLIDFLLGVLNRHGRKYDKTRNLGVISVLGKGIEFIGSVLKKIFQFTALLVGFVGMLIEFSGNLTRGIGYVVSSLLNVTRILYPIGKLVEYVTDFVGHCIAGLGRGIKRMTLSIIAPVFEWLGQKIRHFGQHIVGYSRSFELKRLQPEAKKIIEIPAINLRLRSLLQKKVDSEYKLTCDKENVTRLSPSTSNLPEIKQEPIATEPRKTLSFV